MFFLFKISESAQIPYYSDFLSYTIHVRMFMNDNDFFDIHLKIQLRF